MLLQNFEIYQGLSVQEILFFLSLIIIFSLIINTILLKIALGMVQAEHTEFSEVCTTAFISILFFWLPIIGIIISWIVIYARHEIKIQIAILVWVLTILIGIILSAFIVFGIGLILGVL